MSEELNGELSESSSPDTSNRIDDVEKAHAMADVMDSEASRAAEARSTIRRLEEFPSLDAPVGSVLALKAFSDGLKYFPGEEKFSREDKQRINELKDLKPKAAELLADHPEIGHDVAPELIANGDYLRGHQSRFERSAEEQDQSANRLGEWAGILHDHPVSEGYEEAHPDVGFSPSSLIYLEDDSVEIEAEVSSIEKEVAELSNSEIIVQILEKKYVRGLSEKKLVAMIDSGEATFSEIADAYREAVTERLQPERVKLNAVRAILDDIRSGRASQWQ